MNINLHIERLVLDGISVCPNRQPGLKESVISELGRLLAIDGEGSCITSGSSARVIRGGTISINANRELMDLGQQIAGAVHRGMGK